MPERVKLARRDFGVVHDLRLPDVYREIARKLPMHTMGTTRRLSSWQAT